MASHSKSDSSKLLHDRRQVLGPSLRLFYEEPLHLESGRGCELFDINGRSYLDCYNNVAHVGHGHPAVATAIARQTKQLNTNTRYLIDQVVNYARRLSDLFPDPLNVVRFTCTGSEATDLAYRIAQAATGAKGALVSENAYHGNTSIGLALSPEETGVESVPDWVATMAVSDLLRGTTDGKASNAVRHACEALRAQGHSPAALLFDSLLTSDGIFALDPDIARKWVSDARSSGAVWIADEVQPGFGRTGCAFWGFERFGIVPDMVTLGKPMGNGYPLAAIIMTEAMAQAAQSVYYFNTFAGNPVAAAAGNAVLDVIEDEALQAKAQSVGALLVDELSTLARSHPSISEIRGLGLHLGVDMIDPSSKQPSAEFAQLLVNRLKKHRVLVGRTGQHMNVMKIRPPLAFGVEEVPLLISAVDCALGELGI